MALIKLGQIAADIRGSIGGTVFARNRAGAYTRNRTKPINPMTDRQSEVRSNFGAIATAWSNLTDQQRVDWQDQAAGLTRLNRLGEPYTPTGRQLFMEVNTTAITMGLPLKDDAPTRWTAPDAPVVTSTTLTQVAGALTVFTVDGPAAVPVAIYATPPTPSTKNNLQQRYRFLGYNAAPPNPLDLEALYVARFGTNMPAGAVVGLQLRGLDLDNYLVSPVIQVTAQA